MKEIKQKLYDIVFESNTKQGRIFDISLLILIFLSVFLVLVESVENLRLKYQNILWILEWTITLIFTLEYLLRILIVKNKFRFIISFYGIIDLLSILPTYLSLIFSGSHFLIVIRVLRMLRIFRIFKLTNYTYASHNLGRSIWSSRQKIGVFFFFMVIIVIIIGTLIYMIEGEENGFKSIPLGIYWAIVTLTTVGYGDLSPVSPLGKLLASVVMILGYAIIAVPTGIVTYEIINPKKITNTEVCPNCFCQSHDDDAIYCKKCGELINPKD